MDINISNYLRLDIIDMALVLVSTFVLVFIAKKYFFKNILDYLNKRQQFIQAKIDDANEIEKDANLLKEKYENEISNVKDECKELISEAKGYANEQKEVILTNAKEEASQILSKAQKDIELEKSSVEKQIRDEMSEIAFLAAEKIVEKELDEDKHKEFVQDFIKKAGEK